LGHWKEARFEVAEFQSSEALHKVSYWSNVEMDLVRALVLLDHEGSAYLQPALYFGAERPKIVNNAQTLGIEACYDLATCACLGRECLLECTANGGGDTHYFVCSPRHMLMQVSHMLTGDKGVHA
jgi:hypothetical protein